MDRAQMDRFPLSWPTGWKRTAAPQRTTAKFGKGEWKSFDGGGGYNRKRTLTVADGVQRVLGALDLMGINEGEVIISTNVRTRLDGLPYSGQAEPNDPGVAVYWRDYRVNGSPTRCMAVDRYTKVADNLAAVAATLEAMRSIERHGGAAVLDRAFLGFAALSSPKAKRTWREVMGFDIAYRPHADDIQLRYRELASKRHPDKGGSDAAMSELNVAMREAEEEIA